jgi:pyruvate formate-lyase/glycerol dehydratase family glycyl radical enzyme
MVLAAREIAEDLSRPTERIARLRAELVAEPYSICLERPKLIGEFERSPEGRRVRRDEHPLVRRSMALSYLFSNRAPRIYPDELIVGNMTSRRVAANYYMEGGSVNILEDVFRLDNKATRIELPYRERAQLVAVGLRNVFKSIGGRALLRPGRFKHFLDFFTAKRYFITEEGGVGHQVGDYRSVVHDGLRKADTQAALCLETGRLVDGTPIDEDQRAFFRSVMITVEGIRRMAANLADEAERLSSEPGLSPERRAELLESAAACRRVPYEPARTFLEGLQAVWLVHVAMNLEDFEQGMSFGRLDQILYPLYTADIEAGRLTRERAVELLAGFGLKTCETMPLYSERIDQFFSGNGVAQAITVGGTDPEGNDVSNELSGLILDSYAQILTREPALHVRIHQDSPPWLLEKAVEVIQLGTSRPSLFGDEAVVEALKTAGMSEAHARDYAVIGCVEMASQGRTYNSSDACLFNVPLCLELALNEGRRFPRPGGRERISRTGARTPPVTAMRKFDDVVQAFRAQVADGLDEVAKVLGWLEETYRVWRPTPVNSIVTAGCLDSGKDVTWGGALYDFTSIQAVGMADAGDSLLAIKKLVFDEKRFTLAELVSILKSDFDGHEPLRAELASKLPRYGNGDREADRMAQVAADAFSDAVTSHRNTRGGRYIPGFYSMTCYIGFGRKTGALPDGRRYGERMSNGLAPVDGKERCGPTAVLQSAAGLDSSKWGNCHSLNMKFEKSVVAGEKGRDVLTGLFQTYFDMGGMQVQVNVLDADMLRAARDDPTLYPDLVVRVAGYCVYFNDLQPAVKDEIIERTAHGI